MPHLQQRKKHRPKLLNPEIPISAACRILSLPHNLLRTQHLRAPSAPTILPHRTDEVIQVSP